MRKYFIVCLIWELLRFFLLLFFVRKDFPGGIILWFASQQLVVIYLYIFLCYNVDVYNQYMKVAAAAKFLGIVAGAAYLAGIIIRQGTAILTIITSNILLVDIAIMIGLLLFAKKYFKNILREENAGHTNS